MFNWNSVISDVIPQTLDVSSSNTIVYIRKNIEQETWTDRYGEEHIRYRYEECKVPKDTYQEIMAAIRPISSSMADIRGDLDFLMMMNPDDELSADDNTEETPSDEPSTEPVVEDDPEDSPPDRGDFYG